MSEGQHPRLLTQEGGEGRGEEVLSSQKLRAPRSGSMASQARHESVAQQTTCASRKVVPSRSSRGERDQSAPLSLAQERMVVAEKCIDIAGGFRLNIGDKSRGHEYLPNRVQGESGYLRGRHFERARGFSG